MIAASALGGRVTFAKEIIEKVLPNVSHANLARIAGGVSQRHTSTQFGASVGRLCTATGEGQREATQHRSNYPSGVPLTQQKPRSLAFFFADRAVVNFDFIYKYPSDGVTDHSHSNSFQCEDGYARQGCSDLCRNHQIALTSGTGRSDGELEGVEKDVVWQRFSPAPLFATFVTIFRVAFLRAPCRARLDRAFDWPAVMVGDAVEKDGML
jgi:hypothetical protein